MLALREKAIEFINDIPDDKVVYILEVFKGLEGFLNKEKPQSPEVADPAQPLKSAMGICKQYANVDLIYLEKEAWGMAMEEKHANR